MAKLKKKARRRAQNLITVAAGCVVAGFVALAHASNELGDPPRVS